MWTCTCDLARGTELFKLAEIAAKMGDFGDFVEIIMAIDMQEKTVLSLCKKLKSPLEQEHEVEWIEKMIKEYLEGFFQLEKCDELLQKKLSELRAKRKEGQEKWLDEAIKSQNNINTCIRSNLYGQISTKISLLKQVKLRKERTNALPP